MHLKNDYNSEIIALLDLLVKKGKTLVMITHDEELAKNCDRQIKLLDGNIVGEQE